MFDATLRHPLRYGAISLLLALAAGCHDSSGVSASKAIDAPEPKQLMAGAASGLIKVPVGTPLGGYLRPPVGGEYIPGAEALAAGDPSVLLNELLDFLPTATDHDGVPLAPIPDELRKLTSPYATISPPSRGYYDSLTAKAVALYDGNDYVVFLKMDTIGSLDELSMAIADQVQADTGIDLHNALVISATHTHDGPGAIANHSIRFFWVAMDIYQPALFPQLVPHFAKVVEDALANLQPARIGYAFGQEGYEHPTEGPKNLNSFRRARLDTYDMAANDALRQRMGVVRVDTAAGDPLALILNYAVHGIAFDVENQYYSGDVAASAEREIEQSFDKPVVAMLVQNTGGDVSPRADGGPVLQRIERFGKIMAPQARRVYDGIKDFDEAPDLRVISQRIILNRERLGYTGAEYPYPWGGIECNSDAAVPFVGVPDSDQKIPTCILMPPPDAQDLQDNGVGENGAWGPQDTRLMAVKLGKALVLPQPGEPLTEYGVRLLKLAQDEGYSPNDTFIWGYANDHVGYILAPEKADWDMGGTEGTTTFWGWKQGQRFLDGDVQLMRAMRDGTEGPADEFALKYTYDAIYNLVPKPVAIPSLRAGRVVTEPDASITRFQKTSFAWEGGDPVVDFPTVLLEQQQADGSWAPMRRHNGTPMDTLFEMHLRYRLITAAHVWALDFEAPVDWPLGTYRFRASGTAGSAYAVESEPFEVKPATNLVLSAVLQNGPQAEVTLAYTPVPNNYRTIDPLVRSENAAPVRHGTVTFSSGGKSVSDDTPDLEVRDGQLYAVYRAALDGEAKASGSDIYGNTTP